MPESRRRPGAPYTEPPQRQSHNRPSPSWLAPTMAACFVLGVLWLAVFYITGNEVPGLSALGNWNIAVGFAFISVGFALATRWR